MNGSYKLVGILDLFLAGSEALVQIAFLFFVYPRLFSLYSEMNHELSSLTQYAPRFSVIFLLIYFAIFFIGIRLIKKPTRILFVMGLLALVFLLTVSGYFTAFIVLGSVQPIYNLTTSF